MNKLVGLKIFLIVSLFIFILLETNIPKQLCNNKDKYIRTTILPNIIYFFLNVNINTLVKTNAVIGIR